MATCKINHAHSLHTLYKDLHHIRCCVESWPSWIWNCSHCEVSLMPHHYSWMPLRDCIIHYYMVHYCIVLYMSPLHHRLPHCIVQMNTNYCCCYYYTAQGIGSRYCRRNTLSLLRRCTRTPAPRSWTTPSWSWGDYWSLHFLGWTEGQWGEACLHTVYHCCSMTFWRWNDGTMEWSTVDDKNSWIKCPTAKRAIQNLYWCYWIKYPNKFNLGLEELVPIVVLVRKSHSTVALFELQRLLSPDALLNINIQSTIHGLKYIAMNPKYLYDPLCVKVSNIIFWTIPLSAGISI